jgi:hypothetical protein
VKSRSGEIHVENDLISENVQEVTDRTKLIGCLVIWLLFFSLVWSDGKLKHLDELLGIDLGR